MDSCILLILGLSFAKNLKYLHVVKNILSHRISGPCIPCLKYCTDVRSHVGITDDGNKVYGSEVHTHIHKDVIITP